MGISADTIQIAQFLGSCLKAVLATALIGGTAIVGKTIIDEKIDFSRKDANPGKEVIKSTPFLWTLYEKIRTDFQR